MDASEIKEDQVLAFLVPDVLPDPTDILFGCMRHGVVKVISVNEEHFHWQVIAGTAFSKGARGSCPVRYADYLTKLDR